MEMVFENSRGKIWLDGGSGHAPFKIRAAEGMGYVNQSAATAEYPFRGGQKTLNRRPAARIITVSFDSRGFGSRRDDELGRIAHDSGRLYINDGAKSVYADCYISALSAAQVYGGESGQYVAQFTCDYPYFKEQAAAVQPLFGRTKLIKKSLRLPAVFSGRIAGSDVYVGGDKEVYPVISVGEIGGDEDFELTVINESTGSELKLRLPAGKYGLITFDLFGGSISCDGGDFTKYLDENSYMSDFYLRRGENRIRITAAGVEAGTAASVSFENEYITAAEDK